MVLSSSKSTLPPSLQTQFDKLNDKFLIEARSELHDSQKEGDKILEYANNINFELRKDLLLLVGTIFGSSIALSTGRPVSTIFIIGETFLAISIVAGMIILTAYVKSKEWEYSFVSKNSLQAFLIMNEKRIDQEEKNMHHRMIKEYERLMNMTEKGLMNWILKQIPIEKWSQIFDMSLVIGVLLILLSIVPITNPLFNQEQPIPSATNSSVLK